MSVIDINACDECWPYACWCGSEYNDVSGAVDGFGNVVSDADPGL